MAPGNFKLNQHKFHFELLKSEKESKVLLLVGI